jgi:hypothetical protein
MRLPTRGRTPRGLRSAPSAIALAIVALALPASADAGPLAKALDHLSARQDPVGGGFAAEAGTDPALTAWGAMAVAAAGEDPGRWRRGRASLARAVGRPLERPMLGDLERAAVAAAAAGLDPRDVGGRDLVRAVLRAQRGDGAIGDSPSTTAWGILALRAGGLRSGARPIRLARAALERLQRPDGGWSLAPEAPGSGPNTTSVAVQALVAAGRSPGRSPALAAARDFLAAAENPDGGFPAIVGGESTALTTAWVVVALSAIGEDPAAAPWSRAGGPLSHLRRLQLPDGGVRNTRGSPESSVWATSQAVLAFTRRPLPLGLRAAGDVPRRVPRVVWREPAAGGRVAGPLIVRYRDEDGGTGVDPRAVRLALDGRDVTGRALVTPFALQYPGAGVPARRVTVRLTLGDRAGHEMTTSWQIVGARGR